MSAVSVACFALCCVAGLGELLVVLLVDVANVAGVVGGLAVCEQKVDMVLWRDFGGRPGALALTGSGGADVLTMWPGASRGLGLLGVVDGCFSCPVAVGLDACIVVFASLSSCFVCVNSCWRVSIPMRWAARAES